MRLRRVLPAALGAALILSGCARPAPTTPTEEGARRFGNVTFQPCSLTGLFATQTVEAFCATYAVPEDPAKPRGREIALNMAWLPADTRAGGTRDPIVFIAGGPGQAATQHASTIQAALAPARRQRDILLIDQRGTGKSAPLECRNPDGSPMKWDASPLSSNDAVAAFAAACAKAMQGRADPALYTTTVAVADLEAVRKALAVDQLNLMGVSYGTRVAQQYAKRHPAHTRTIVLDGVAPNTLVVGGEFARMFDRALALQRRYCDRTPTCKARFPVDLRTQLVGLRDRLAAAPQEVEYRDPRTGVVERETLSEETVLGLAHMFSYMPQMASLLPLVISEAEQGRYAPLMALADLGGGDMQQQMTRGMQLSVLCAEDADRYVPDPADADTVLGPEMSDAFFAACRSWPKGVRPPDFNEPLRSQVPALLLSGELDPVTPPEYADAVLKGLPNGRHLVLRGQGHNVSAVGCMPKLVARFIDSADARGLDVSCTKSIDFVPPFSSFNGWEP